MTIVKHSIEKERLTKAMVIARAIFALFGLLLVFLGLDDAPVDARTPCFVFGGVFLAASFFAGRRVIAGCYFLLGLGLVIAASKGGQGHVTYGFLGSFSAAASLFLYRGWFWPLVATGRVGTVGGANQSHDESETTEIEEGQFPDLVKLSSSELKAVVSTDRVRYAEAYVRAAEHVLKNKTTELNLRVSSAGGSGTGRRLANIMEVDRRILLLAVGFLMFVKSFEIIFSLFNRIPIFHVAYYVLFVDTILAIKLLERKWWARGCLIVLCLFGLVARLSEFYLEGNILGAVDSFLYSFVFLALLGLRITFRRGIMFVCGYLVCAILFLSYVAYVNHFARSAVASMASPSVVRSNRGYQLSLEGLGWKVVPSGEVDRMIPNLSPNVDAVLVKGDATELGTLSPEDLGAIKVNDESLAKIADFLEKTYFSTAIYKTVSNIPSGRLVSGIVRQQGKELAMIGFWKAYKTVAINGVFWSATQDLPVLRRDVGALIERVIEVPLRDRLPQPRPAEIFSRNSDSVVLIRTYNEEGEVVSFGSGFNVKKDGLIVTNLHMLLGVGSYLDVKFPSGKVFDGVSIVGVGKDGADLALLKLNGKDLPFVQEPSRVDVEVGDPVYVISNPEGLINSLSDGIVSAIRPDSDSTLYQITAAISAGSSGGAVFDQFGRVIGVATSRIEGAESLNFATPIKGLESLRDLPNAFSLKEFIALLDKASKDKNAEPQQQLVPPTEFTP